MNVSGAEACETLAPHLEPDILTIQLSLPAGKRSAGQTFPNITRDSECFGRRHLDSTVERLDDGVEVTEVKLETF